MKKTKKFLSLLTSAAMLVSPILSMSANAEFSDYGKHWYYSDDLSFKYWGIVDVDDYGMPLSDEVEESIDFCGATPQNQFEVGKEDYSVPIIVYGENINLDVKIGLRGDAENDGVVNLYDVIFIAKTIIGEAEFNSGFHEFVSDYNIDGKTDLYDMIDICKMILHSTVIVPPTPPQPPVNTDENNPERIEAYVKEVAALVNKERAAVGLPALTMTTELNAAAQVRAVEISGQEDIEHERPDGSSCFTVLDEKNIFYYYAGENIAGGYKTPEAVVEGWMNSEGHRANILDPYYNKIGIGYYENTSNVYSYYWTQFFIQD